MIHQSPGRKLHFFAPGLKHYDSEGFHTDKNCGLAAVSVTGSSCGLNCKHCGATILQSMRPATTPSALMAEARRAAGKGAPGLLISGGSLPNGAVPIEPFLETLKKIKQELDIDVLLHTGLVSEKVAGGLAEAAVDCVMLDIIGEDATISEVCNLNATVDDFRRSLDLLCSRNIPVAPHVIMGLHFGKVRGEERALRMISEFPVKAVVMVGFRPLPGTQMAGVSPLSPDEMGKLFILARKMFPRTPLLLGCERPLGEHREETDRLALEAGLDGIAFPCDSAVEWAREHNADLLMKRTCCSMICDR